MLCILIHGMLFQNILDMNGTEKMSKSRLVQLHINRELSDIRFKHEKRKILIKKDRNCFSVP